jgi:hypothetical protein
MLEGNPIVVHRIHIPSDNPVFLTIIFIHVAAAMVCVVAGIVAMFAKKQPGVHPKAGKIYYSFLWVVFITVLIIAIVRWTEDYYLLILGTISFLSAFIGRKALKNKWGKWTIIHISCMGFSYIVLLTAFYVDNGKSLPVWENFPPLIYWILPTLIGIPIIIITLLRHPLSRGYFGKT